MTYKLYRATDTRDSRVMLWLHCTRTSKVAQFHIKTAVTRIKRLTCVAPGGLSWSPEGDLAKHATNVELIESWS
jgi:hypothetical protein